MEEQASEVKLPGFRFHPTEEELLNFYLKRIVSGKKLCGDIIGSLNIYDYDPRELPGLARIGEREWYFFVPRGRKQRSGGRPNRTTEKGFWKATGSDRRILSMKDPKNVLGLKKTLVFYEGRAPRGRKTDWVMNEYRLPPLDSQNKDKDIVLCKIYRKATSLKALEQRAAAAVEEEQEQVEQMVEWEEEFNNGITTDIIKTDQQQIQDLKKKKKRAIDDVDFDVAEEEEKAGVTITSNLMLPELQLPKFNMDWTQDSFWTQLRSPWLDNFLPMC